MTTATGLQDTPTPPVVAAATQPIDTTTATGKHLLGVLPAVAEFGRALIRERTQDGLARARSQGKRLGRPPGKKDGNGRKQSGYFRRWAGKRENEAVSAR